MKSIRRQLSVRLLAAGTVLLLASVAICLIWTKIVVLRQFDANLESRARALCSLVQQDPAGALEVTPIDSTLQEFSDRSQPDYLQIWDAGGRLLLRSKSLRGRDIPGPAPSDSVVFWDANLPDGRAGRGVRVRVFPGLEQDAIDLAATNPAFVPPTGKSGPITLALLQDDMQVRQIEQAILITLTLSAVLGFVGMLIGIPRMVNSGLAQLQRLSEQAVEIDANHLSRRFGLNDLPAELLPICGRLNDLLVRLDAAFQRERRFSANVAHELRTPIAELKAMAEVALRWPGDSTLTRRGFDDALAIACQMESIVSTLLKLSRAESGGQVVSRRTVDLSQLVSDVWKAHSPKADARGLQIHLNLASPLEVETDPTLFQVVASNLLQNAVTYCSPGGVVSIRTSSAAGGEELWVSNSDQSLSDEDLQHLTEPFWRKDPSRSSSEHAGLGLAVVHQYARAIGAQVQFRHIDGNLEVRVLMLRNSVRS